MINFRADCSAYTRIAFEYCEESALNGVAYFETRFTPQSHLDPEKVPAVTAEHIIRAVLEGLRQGEEKFGVKVRSQLSMCTKKLINILFP